MGRIFLEKVKMGEGGGILQWSIQIHYRFLGEILGKVSRKNLGKNLQTELWARPVISDHLHSVIKKIWEICPFVLFCWFLDVKASLVPTRVGVL